MLADVIFSLIFTSASDSVSELSSKREPLNVDISVFSFYIMLAGLGCLYD